MVPDDARIARFQIFIKRSIDLGYGPFPKTLMEIGVGGYSCEDGGEDKGGGVSALK